MFWRLRILFFDTIDAFEPRAEIKTKYFSHFKKKMFKNYYIRVERQSQNKILGIEGDIDYDIPAKFYK